MDNNSVSHTVKLVECPRDAMQGVHQFIATEKKAAYMNQLLQVGFDTLDFGSFVSPKAIPQMRDTAEVLGMLDLSATKTRLLAIVANERGAEEACRYPGIQYLGTRSASVKHFSCATPTPPYPKAWNEPWPYRSFVSGTGNN